jgi:hypothetical protein
MLEHSNDDCNDEYIKIDKIDKKVKKNKNKKIDIEQNECFICYEICIPKPIQLEYQTTYIKLCGCNSLVHQFCLDKWHKLHKSCPICRMQMNKHNIITSVIFQRNKKMVHYYIYIKKNIHIIIAKFLMLSFCYMLYVFYLEVFYAINM